MRLLLIDGSNVMWRSLLAKPQHGSQKTGAVIAFTRSLLAACDQLRAERVAIVFDGPGKSFRSLLAGTYKSSRERDLPPELSSQIPSIFRMAEALGFTVLRSAPYEADDVIASLAARHSEDEVIIFSDDKDLGALVRGTRVRQQRPRDSSLENSLLDERAIRERWKVSPLRVPDVQALCGDSVDEVGGLHGVGPVYAMQAIASHGSFERFALEAADGKGKRWMQRAAAMADARRMIDSTRMLEDVPAPKIAPRSVDWPERTTSLLMEIGAEATAEAIAKRHGVSIRAGKVVPTTRRRSLF